MLCVKKEREFFAKSHEKKKTANSSPLTPGGISFHFHRGANRKCSPEVMPTPM